MNNIKYKAWDNDKKKMAKVKAIDWDCNDKIVTCHLEYENGYIEKKYPEKDYGDDIVFLPHIARGVYSGDIYRVYGGECIYGTWEYNETLIADEWNTLKELEYAEYVDVLGNIFENPELLK